jgi:seryl-tRNA synthetase
MALEDQAKAVTKLGSLGTDIPKLNADSVIENIIKKDETLGKYLVMVDAAKEEKIERGMTKEEADKAAEEAKKKILEEVKKNLKPAVEEDIIKMKQEYKTAKEALDSIPTEVQTTMALVAVPTAISVPPSSANPAYTLGIALQTKKSLLKTLNIVLSSLTTVMMLANKLKFELPAPILKLVETLTIVTKGLSVIPG